MEPEQLTATQDEKPNKREPPAKEPSGPHPEENNRVKLPMTFRALNETTQSDQWKSQLIVRGIVSEFPLLKNTFESGETWDAVAGLHMRLENIEVQEGDIIGAAPTIVHARNNSHAPIKITYRDRKTKNKILQVARETGLLGQPKTLEKMGPFFMEVAAPPNNKTQQKKKKVKESSSKMGNTSNMNNNSLATAEEKMLRAMENREVNVRR